MTTRDPLAADSLQALYRRLVDGEPAAPLFAEIDRRGELAGAIYDLQTAELPQHYLDDYVERLTAALDPDLPIDADTDAADAAEREIVRVQLAAITRERDRRIALVEAVERHDAYAPPRSDLVGSIMGVGTGIDVEGPAAHFYDTTQRIGALVARLVAELPPGAGRVAHILREAEALPSEGEPHPIDPWVRAGLALQILLGGEHGAYGHRVSVDPVTLAEADRANRLFLALGRQDQRYEEIDWPLDLSGTAIADLIERADRAGLTWTERGLDPLELDRYLTPTRREERGRPAPHPQVVPEGPARALAERAGGVPAPMVYQLNVRERAHLARQLWTEGLPPVPPKELGLLLYSAGGDPRVRWGAPPYPLGVLCAVALPANFILRLGHPDAADDEAQFNALTEEATRRAQATGGDYADVLRDLLLKQGVHAIARYDHLNAAVAHPQEFVLLDPRPETVMIVRESVPSFMRGDVPLIVAPAQHTTAPVARPRSPR